MAVGRRGREHGGRERACHVLGLVSRMRVSREGGGSLDVEVDVVGLAIIASIMRPIGLALR